MCFPNIFRHDRLESPNIYRDGIIQKSTYETTPTEPSQIRPISKLNQPLLAAETATISNNHTADNNNAQTHTAVIPQIHLATMPSGTEELATELRNARIKCPQPHTYFVPLSEIHKLITPQTVEREILAGNPNLGLASAQMHAERAFGSCQKLFAILAFRKFGSKICSFLESNISDKDLPFRKEEGKWILWQMEPKQRIQVFDGWEEDEVEEFYRRQWWMIPPVFDKNKPECLELADEAVLPFIPINEDAAKDQGIPHMMIGGYSEVSAYLIHAAHHNFGDASLHSHEPFLIADKKLISTDRVDFMKEKTILDALGAQNHPHLIQLLSSYRKEKHYHLIFPCANANLRRYWEINAAPEFEKQTVLWSVRQMSGIASALDCIHSFRVKYDLNVDGGTRTPISGGMLSVKAGEEKYGRHGDIKPENMLYFIDSNLLKITDFGLGRFHGRDSRSGIDPRKVVGSLTYEPPECTIERAVSRAYDIWSLGCLYLEFVTWLLEGSKQIEKFADERGKEAKPGPINDDNFFSTITNNDHEKDAEVRPAVLKWVDHLRAHKNCSSLMHDLLDLVMTHMLQPHPNDRITALKLKQEMEKLVRTAESDDVYLLRGAPRPLPPPLSKPLPRLTVSKPPTDAKVRWADQQIPATPLKAQQ